MTAWDLIRFFIIWSTISTIVSFLGGLIVYRFLTFEMKIILTYCGAGTLFEFLNLYFRSRHLQSQPLVHILTIIEYVTLMTVFVLWQKEPLLRKILSLSIPIYVLVGAISFFNVENVHRFSIYTRPFAQLFIIVASAYTLYQINQEIEPRLFRKPQFWVSSALLIYFGSTLILWASLNSLLGLKLILLQKIFLLNEVANIVASSLILTGFLCMVPERN